MEDGIDRSAIREIKLLREIEHDNVISVFVSLDDYLFFC